jgi:hypothetical protein
MGRSPFTILSLEPLEASGDLEHLLDQLGGTMITPLPSARTKLSPVTAIPEHSIGTLCPA